MSETETPEAATPQFKAAQRWNVVWVVPILALLIGALVPVAILLASDSEADAAPASP